MAPQILSKNYYTYKCDVWSLGIIIYEMFFDGLPWKAQDAESLFFNIMKHPYPYMEGKGEVPVIIMFLLKNTLQYLEKDRLSWGDLLNAVKNINSFSQQAIGTPPAQQISLPYQLPQQPHPSIPRYEI